MTGVSALDKEPIDVLSVEHVLQEIAQGHVSQGATGTANDPGLLVPAALSPSHSFGGF